MFSVVKKYLQLFSESLGAPLAPAGGKKSPKFIFHSSYFIFLSFSPVVTSYVPHSTTHRPPALMKKVNDIAGISAEEMARLQSVFEDASTVVEVILYGSRANGAYRPGSDIDLTLKGTALTTGWLMDLAAKIDDLLLPYEVDLSIFDHIDNPSLIDHIQRIGKVVFSNE